MENARGERSCERAGMAGEGSTRARRIRCLDHALSNSIRSAAAKIRSQLRHQIFPSDATARRLAAARTDQTIVELVNFEHADGARGVTRGDCRAKRRPKSGGRASWVNFQGVD
jgi:hypothetical protein